MRELPSRLALELRVGDNPSLVLTQGDNWIRLELVHVKGLMAALTDTAADLAEVLASGGKYHA